MYFAKTTVGSSSARKLVENNSQHQPRETNNNFYMHASIQAIPRGSRYHAPRFRYLARVDSIFF
jgi:hypothetical protein